MTLKVLKIPVLFAKIPVYQNRQLFLPSGQLSVQYVNQIITKCLQGKHTLMVSGGRRGASGAIVRGQQLSVTMRYKMTRSRICNINL